MVKNSSNMQYPTGNVKSSKLFQFKPNLSDLNQNFNDDYSKILGKTYDIIGDK